MRLRWFLLLSAVLVATVGFTVVVHDRLEGSRAADQRVGAPGAGGSTAPSGTGAGGPRGGVDAGSAVRVEGTISALHLEGAVPEPRLVATPLTLVSERGFGNGAELTGVEVGGVPSAVVWDGGRPFVLAAGAGLVPDPVVVDLVPEGLRVGLGGGVHALRPGSYRLETPVAVGQAGVATPYDAVAFVAGPAARLAAAGDTALVLGPDRPHRFLGPGLVRLEGDLQVGPDGGPRTDRLAVTGPFDLTVSPTADGRWHVTGLVAAEGLGGEGPGEALGTRG